jgi:hypothetical protein
MSSLMSLVSHSPPSRGRLAHMLFRSFHTVEVLLRVGRVLVYVERVSESAMGFFETRQNIVLTYVAAAEWPERRPIAFRRTTFTRTWGRATRLSVILEWLSTPISDLVVSHSPGMRKRLLL